MYITTLFTISLATLVAARFRLGCSTLVTERIDPLISPNGLSGHVHTVFGASNFAANANAASLNTSICSTCPVKEDMSAYWVPTVYFMFKNGSLLSLPPPNAGIYYAPTNNQTKAFPNGLAMIEGNMAARSAEDAGLGISWGCKDEFGNSVLTPGFPAKQCYDGLHANIVFPVCWDGKTLWSPDQSHTASTVGFGGSCPDTHPVVLPTLFMEVTWSTAGFNDMWDQAANTTQPFVLSQGDTTGYGLHADAFLVWDETTLQKALDTCTGDSFGTDCAPFTYTVGDICKKAPDVDEETGLSLISKLPGGCQLTQGPDEETDCTGVASRLNKKQPYVGLYNQSCPATTILTQYNNYAYTSCLASSSAPVTTILPILNMTVQTCLDACDAQNAPFCVVSYNSECRMGNSLNATVMIAIDEYNCHQPCVGDPTYACGPNYLVYTRGGQPATPSENPGSGGVCSPRNFASLFSFQGSKGKKAKPTKAATLSDVTTTAAAAKRAKRTKHHQGRIVKHRKKPFRL